MIRKTIQCTHCCSENIWVDANAHFNYHTQEWELGETMPDYFCEQCDGMCSVKDVYDKEETEDILLPRSSTRIRAEELLKEIYSHSLSQSGDRSEHPCSQIEGYFDAIGVDIRDDADIEFETHPDIPDDHNCPSCKQLKEIREELKYEEQKFWGEK